MTRTSLEVWGDPIDHSLSPRLHRAAYAHLGLPWTYDRRRVDAQTFPAELAAAADRVRGLSLTMPLKTLAWAAAVRRDARAELTGAVNTLVFTPAGPAGFNTDVGGIVRALADEGTDAASRARIVGAGATATSALVALAEIGATTVQVVARRAEAVSPLAALGARLGVAVTASGFADRDRPDVDVTIATLPGDAPLAADDAAALADGGGPLLDVVYGHWPSVLSRAWDAVGASAVNGTGMLLHQAVLQVRAFATGDVTAALPDERGLVAVMRRALMGD